MRHIAISNEQNQLANLTNKLFKTLSIKTSCNLSNRNTLRARITPKQIRSLSLFSHEASTWLDACATKKIMDYTSGKVIHTFPLIGITNRPLPGFKKAGLNLFTTTVRIISSKNIKNLDECTLEFGKRLPINTKDFIEEMCRQIYSTSYRSKGKGRLTFYAHNSCVTATASDLESLRLSLTNTMPVINIDWLDQQINWEKYWTSSSSLETNQSKMEANLIKILDLIIQCACPSYCNALIQNTNSFLDNIYLPYRQNECLPDLNKVSFLPDSDTQNNRILELFKAEKELLAHIKNTKQSLGNYTYSFNDRESTNAIGNDTGWMPATI